MTLSDETCGSEITIVADRSQVLHVLSRLNVGGPARLVTAVARAEGSAVATGAVPPGEVEYDDLGQVRLHRVTGLGPRIGVTSDVRAAAGLGAVMRRERPLIVHTHTAKAGALGRPASVATGVPYRVHTFHGHLLHGYFGRRVTATVAAVERQLARRTDRLVSVGRRVRDDLLDAGVGRPEQYDVIYPGVALGPLPPREEARRRLGLGLGEQDTVVGFVARLAGIKRPDRVLEVARRLPDAVFLVVGDGGARTQLESVAPRNVRFLGWRRDVEAIYSACDLTLLTSDNEGMPVTLIESALAGVPSVTTAVGSADEVVVDGETGLCVPPDVAALTEAAARLLGDASLRASMGAAATARAGDLFTVDAMVQAHRRLYAQVAAR